MRTTIAACAMLLGLSACAARAPLNVDCPDFAKFTRDVPYSELERVIHSGDGPLPAPASDLTRKLDSAVRAQPRKVQSGGALSAAQPAMAVLMLSGGGQWGAFGAGYFDQARRNGGLPDFGFVSGVSTGALQALFVSIGTPEAYDMLLRSYAPPRRATSSIGAGRSPCSSPDRWRG